MIRHNVYFTVNHVDATPTKVYIPVRGIDDLRISTRNKEDYPFSAPSGPLNRPGVAAPQDCDPRSSSLLIENQAEESTLIEVTGVDGSARMEDPGRSGKNAGERRYGSNRVDCRAGAMMILRTNSGLATA